MRVASAVGTAGFSLCRAVVVVGLVVLATQAMGARWVYDADPALGRDPYRYTARQLLVPQCRRDRHYASAYWHAAWLAWFAPQRFADSGEGGAFLRDRGNRDRAASDPAGPLPAIAAVDARRLLDNSCLSGTLAQQASRLRREIADLLARAEQQEAAAARDDPVSRIALARIALALDDAWQLDSPNVQTAPRLSLLRTAATRVETVAAWLPDAPGPHRLLAVVRARLAAADGRGEQWELAIVEANRAYNLDPADPYLTELLWTLHLRAGHWAEAATWKLKVEANSRAMSAPGDTVRGLGPGAVGPAGVH